MSREWTPSGLSGWPPGSWYTERAKTGKAMASPDATGAHRLIAVNTICKGGREAGEEEQCIPLPLILFCISTTVQYIGVVKLSFFSCW